jgi:hypothetical protein
LPFTGTDRVTDIAPCLSPGEVDPMPAFGREANFRHVEHGK